MIKKLENFTMEQLFQISILLLGVVLCTVGEEIYGTKWDYSSLSNIGPANWGKTFPTCNGKQQSPVNIDTKHVEYNANLGSLELTGYDQVIPNLHFFMENHGHSVVVKPSLKNSTNPVPILVMFKGAVYRFAQLHFHWGLHNDRGSEHQINGKPYPAELHIIHHNIRYSDLHSSVEKKDGLLVWGHLIQVGEESQQNSGLDFIIRQIKNIEFAGTNVTIPVDIPMSWILSSHLQYNKYFTYKGSLTTPGCFETVRWVVDDKIKYITTKQIEAFRRLYEHKRGTDLVTLVDNYRPVQELHGRKIESSFKVKESSAAYQIAGETTTILVSLLIVLSLKFIKT